MKKFVTDNTSLGREPAFMNLTDFELIEVTSEEPQHPIEQALIPGESSGWLAAKPGPQVIRIRFHAARGLSLIHLYFEVIGEERTQEFALSYLSEGDTLPREIVRQQWNFSPGGSTHEIENYEVKIEGVREILLHVNPDLRHGRARASLKRLFLA
jgi:hypothetical protein